MKLSVIIVVLAPFLASAQLTREHAILGTKTDLPRMCSALWHLGAMAANDSLATLQYAASLDMQVRSDGKIYVQIQRGWDTAVDIDPEVLGSLGIEVQDHYRNTAGCWVNPDKLIATAEILEGDMILRSANRHSVDHEGVIVTNSLDYKTIGGANGQGFKIGVIDLGYSLLTNAQMAGTAPNPPADTVDWTGTGLMTGTPHGTGCTEICFEYATQATYYLHKITGEPQLGNAINDLIGDGVDMITSSISYYNTGWADGTGVPCAAVKDATDAGILFFHGSGNFNLRHYQGVFTTTDGDDWHEYVGLDETNEVNVANGVTITIYMQWEGTPSSTNDFDLYLFDEANGNQLASATLSSDYEVLNWTNNTGSTVTAEVAVFRFNSSNDDFEYFISTNGLVLQFGQTGGSSASPSNSLEDLCITVGAIDNDEYDEADPQAESFSSRGPTNGGRIVPDLIAPDDLTLVSYPNGFSGSSAGGPNTCGLTAVLWSEHTYLSATGIKELVRGLAALYNDWGDPGKDNTFGEGGIYLPDFTDNARFIYPGANNTGGLSTLPYLSFEQANDIAPVNTNIFFLGGVHSVPVGIIDSPMKYRSLEENAIIKN